MRKTIFWIGLALFLIGLVLFFLSGSTGGPDLKPTVPILYANQQLQIIWMLLGIAGLVILIVGLVLKPKK